MQRPEKSNKLNGGGAKQAPKPINESLNKRLAVYALAATAAGVGLLAGSANFLREGKMKRNLFKVTILAAALAVACLGVGAGTALADIITFNVSGTLEATDLGGAASCVSSGCTLGGTLTINNSSGAPDNGFVSADITMDGESPVSGPFTLFSSVSYTDGQAKLVLEDVSGDELGLVFSVPAGTSLVGYTGGDVFNVEVQTIPINAGGAVWKGVVVSLTPSTPAAAGEPGSLMLLGVVLLGGLWIERKRIFAH